LLISTLLIRILKFPKPGTVATLGIISYNPSAGT